MLARQSDAVLQALLEMASPLDAGRDRAVSIARRLIATAIVALDNVEGPDAADTARMRFR